MERVVKPTPVPLAGFFNLSAVSKQTRVLRLYFAPQPFVGSPFRVFPSRESRAPLEAASSLAVIHQRAKSHRPRPYHRRFPWLPRLHAVAMFPRRLWTPFRHAEARFPVTLGLERRNRFVPPASPTSKPWSSHESVHANQGCP